MKICEVHNVGLNESVMTIHQGKVAQPLSGCAYVRLHGQVFYPFLEDFMLQPKIIVVLCSGQPGLKNAANSQPNQNELFWTTDQVWNKHSDSAILFNENGIEVERHSYRHERITGVLPTAGKF